MVEIGIEPLVRLLGFTGLEDVRYGEHTAAATLGGLRTVAVLIAGWADPLDGLWRLAVVEARRREAGWCLLFNGLHIRLVDAGRVYSRRYVDLDLDEAADEAPTAAALWTLCAAPAFVREPDGTTQIRRLVTASERHGADVCRSLRAGVLDASADVMRAMLVGQPRRSIGVHSSRPSRSSTESCSCCSPRRGLSCRCGTRFTARATASKRCAKRPNGRRCPPAYGTRCAR